MIPLIVLLSLLLAQIPNAPQPASAHAREGYAGDAACRDCHREIFESYLNSPHHLASRLPGPTSIEGDFHPGSNFLRTSNPYLYFEMTATEQGYFQNAVVKLLPSEIIPHTESFDLVIGSGRKGQTYLYWKGDELFELPVSYWTETHRWINSPGYPDGFADFDKPIIPRCLECHSTYIESLPPPLNRFARPTAVLGITCEKCHGPGRAHVERTTSKTPLRPGQTEDIVNPASFARDRQMDLCALCHAGPGTAKAAAFSFAPGGVLAQYLSLPEDAPDTPDDVHAHQVQQLRSSRCFRSSRLTCMTCHDVHRTQRDVASYADRCLTCHKMESCGKYTTLGSQIARNCVDCHMPLRQSNQIVMNAVDGSVKPQVRTHRIAVYR
jgi:Cytochrome c554 and c-prime